MVEKQLEKKKGTRFQRFLVIYGLVLLTVIGIGLIWFWGFMKAYEASRPSTAINAYLENLEKEHILAECSVILDQVDSNIQSEQECMNHLEQLLSGEITYARKASACTDTQQTYMLRCGGTVIGSFVIEATEENAYGFTPWTLREENFDPSELMGTEILSVTVPQGYTVAVNGCVLDESYIAEETRQEFKLLEAFYGAYEMPELVMQTYQAGPFLNAEFEMEVFDSQGQRTVMDDSFDENSLIILTDEAEIQKIDQFLEVFIKSYVRFSGGANKDRFDNYKQVTKYVVSGSKLQQRMYDAVEGLFFAQSKGDKLAEILVNHYVSLSEGRYVVDVTYKVNTTGRQGVVQTTTNVQMLLVTSGENLLVESMIGY